MLKQAPKTKYSSLGGSNKLQCCERLACTRTQVGLGVLAAVAAFVIGYLVHPQSRNRRNDPEHASCWPPGFINFADVAPRAIIGMRYATNHNFIGRRVVGYNAPLCILTEEAATALKQVSDDAYREGYLLKMYDCYRPQQSVDSFVAWSKNELDTLAQAEFYPDCKNKSSLFPQYIALKSGHSRGSTMDLTLVSIPVKEQEEYLPGQKLERCDAKLGVRFGDNSIDMGSGFDCFSAISHTASPLVSEEARQNRMRLKRLMERHNFDNYVDEFWHYTLKHEPYPDTYFNFPIQHSC